MGAGWRAQGPSVEKDARVQIRPSAALGAASASGCPGGCCPRCSYPVLLSSRTPGHTLTRPPAGADLALLAAHPGLSGLKAQKPLPARCSVSLALGRSPLPRHPLANQQHSPVSVLGSKLFAPLRTFSSCSFFLKKITTLLRYNPHTMQFTHVNATTR